MIACSTSERRAAMRPSRWRCSRTASRRSCEKRNAVSVISGSTARLAIVSCQSMTNITPSMPKTTSTSLRMMSTLSTSISRSMLVSPVARSTRSPARCALCTESESRWRVAKEGRRAAEEVGEGGRGNGVGQGLSGGGDQVALVVGEEAAHEGDHQEEHARDARDPHGAVALGDVEEGPAQVMLRDQGVVEDDLDRPGASEGGHDRAQGAHEREDELAADALDVGLEVVKQPDETFPADVLKERVLLQGHSG